MVAGGSRRATMMVVTSRSGGTLKIAAAVSEDAGGSDVPQPDCVHGMKTA